MKCPICKGRLVDGGMKRFETLHDHALRTKIKNLPLRQTYVCTCAASRDLFWDETGEIYSKSLALYRALVDVFGPLHAKDSQCDDSEQRKKLQEFLKRFRIYRWYLERRERRAKD